MKFRGIWKKGVKKKEAQTWFSYKARNIAVIGVREKYSPFPFLDGKVSNSCKDRMKSTKYTKTRQLIINPFPPS